MIGYALCGSFCTHQKSLEMMGKLKKGGYQILPIISETVSNTDTRFGTASCLKEQIFTICEREAICNIVQAEPLGPNIKLDIMVICPCTGNTLAKIANGITDTAVCMAAKAHLRGDRPLVIALASNDALSANLQNISLLLSKKHVYFVPMVQDDPHNKPHSLVANFDRLPETIEHALLGKQCRKLFE